MKLGEPWEPRESWEPWEPRIPEDAHGTGKPRNRCGYTLYKSCELFVMAYMKNLPKNVLKYLYGGGGRSRGRLWNWAQTPKLPCTGNVALLLAKAAGCSRTEAFVYLRLRLCLL